MKILLDTHILLWLLSGSDNLSEAAKSAITDADNEIYYSSISIWEIAIKKKLHPESFSYELEDVINLADQSGIVNLPLLNDHVLQWKTLKMAEGAKEHKDPFDRILICQALSAGMQLMTHDSKMPLFDVNCIMEV